MTMAIRNSDIIRSRKNRIAMIAVALFALVASLSFNDAHAATTPHFEDQYAFHLTDEDAKAYGAEYGWCMPTPTDGTQCYVLGSSMAGWLGRGDDNNPVENAKVYGNGEKGPVMIGDLDRATQAEAYDSFKAVWGN